MDEQILRAAKEIIVKFIETGRVSPSGFSEAFKSIYQTVHEAVSENRADTTETSNVKKTG
jgi:DNA topoisomerase VI subunit B